MTLDLDDCVGRSETRVDRLDPARSRALLTSLGQRAVVGAGDHLPLLHHWLYFWRVTAPEGLGRDGHPKRGGFLPSLPDEWRRMWAGGAFDFHKPLRAGEKATMLSTITDVARKTGRSGELVFVTVRHEISGEDGLAVVERQDLVYRAPAPPSASTALAAPSEADWREAVDANAVLLFRYSALTFNGHRIHYDQPYATGVEGYAGLVIHGPLQATLMLDMAERELGGPLGRFEFRGRAPACDVEPLQVCGARTPEGASLWTGQSGGLCMTAKAILA